MTVSRKGEVRLIGFRENTTNNSPHQQPQKNGTEEKHKQGLHFNESEVAVHA